MSTYVISDIHGCFDEFMNMLRIVNFCSDDLLVLAGDYIDRGAQNLEMLRWLERCPENVVLLRGNHDVSFAENIVLLKELAKQDNIDFWAMEQFSLAEWFDKCRERLFELGVRHYDRYGTLEELIKDKHVNASDLKKWKKIISEMPYLYETDINGRVCIVVHAGYIENFNNSCIAHKYTSIEQFYVWARDDAYQYGGTNHGLIIAGHNPTNEDSLCTYNKGRVFRQYNEELDCIYYDIDCGGVYREKESRFSCIRLEDEKIFYLNDSI